MTVGTIIAREAQQTVLSRASLLLLTIRSLFLMAVAFKPFRNNMYNIYISCTKKGYWMRDNWTLEQWKAAFLDPSSLAAQEAFQRLFELLYGRALQCIYRWDELPYLDSVNINQLAEDYAQMVVVKFFKELKNDTYRWEAKPSTWSYRIICHDVNRDLAGRKLEVGSAGITDDPPDEEDTYTPPIADPSNNTQPEPNIEISELRQALGDCFALLTDLQYECFDRTVVLREKAGDVAADLDSNTSAVYRNVFVAREKLKECLNNKGITPDLVKGYFYE